jgi:hypothetical protein
MKISGFSMVKNADSLYYPVKQAIQSILPLVDEFVIAIGDCSPGDNTRKLVESIKDPKVKIIDTVWDLEKYPRGMEHAHQTDIAKANCSGHWLFYLQADEVIHEDDLPGIRQACERYLDDREVEGFLFKYRHFWGDYRHYHQTHGWYPHEIRIIRNDPEIHSWESAQSFRRIPDFDGLNYRRQENTFKLKVVELDAYVYHYGWVRPPELMKKKNKTFQTIHKGQAKVEEMEKQRYFEFDYGPLNWLKKYKGTHPAVMQGWIEKFNWAGELQYDGKPDRNRKPHKHETLKNKIFTFFKYNALRMPALGEFNNFILLKKNIKA